MCGGDSRIRVCSLDLSASLGSASGLVEKSSLLRSLSGSWSLAGSETKGLAKSLSGSLGSVSSLAEMRAGTGSSFTENLHGKFSTTTVLSGHSDCFENIIVNCGSVSASFAFLVVALGVLIFGIYATKQRRQSPARLGGPKAEESFVDKEGWETKGSDDEEGWETKAKD